MKIILALLACIAFATAQDTPAGTRLHSKTSLELRAAVARWRAKLGPFKTPESRKSQEYLILSRQMQKELREIKTKSSGVPLSAAKAATINETQRTFNNKSLGVPGDRVSLADTDQRSFLSQPRSSESVISDTTVYEIPFASKGNNIEISVVNNSLVPSREVRVALVNSPAWLKFDQNEVIFSTLKSKEERSASFSFNVEKTADVSKNQTLIFAITNDVGQKWTNEITVNVAPPATYELFQNYPNPFNPTTTIGYQLPGVGSPFNVSLKVYDLLGRETATVAGGQQPAGYYQSTFDARRFASGVYIFRLVATDSQNKRHVFQKKMLVVK